MTSDVFLFLSAFLASAVEMVEALTIVLAVGVAGVLVHAPLSRVPENAPKFTVGLLLTTFGTFWAEGAGGFQHDLAFTSLTR